MSVFVGVAGEWVPVRLGREDEPPVDTTVPSAPQSVSASASDQSATVSWAAPASDGDTAITSYTVTRSPGGQVTTVDGSTLSALITGLTNGTTYTFAVRAVNAVGPSDPATSNAVTPSAGQAHTLPSGIVIPAGYPNPTNTGWRGLGLTESQLTLHSGNFSTSADGQLVQNLDITGGVSVNHQNVTFRGCRIGRNLTSAYAAAVRSSTGAPGGNNCTIEYCEISGFKGTGNNDQEGIALFRSGLVVRRCDIHDAADGVILVGGTILEDTCIHDLHWESGSHSDCVQISSGRDAVIRRCSLLAFNFDSQNPSNASLQVGSQQGPITGLRMEDCYVNGGNYTVNHNASKQGTYGAITGAYVRNRWGRGFRYGPMANNPAGISVDDTNVYHDTGEPISGG